MNIFSHFGTPAELAFPPREARNFSIEGGLHFQPKLFSSVKIPVPRALRQLNETRIRAI
jgi:hypothetical protein